MKIIKTKHCFLPLFHPKTNPITTFFNVIGLSNHRLLANYPPLLSLFALKTIKNSLFNPFFTTFYQQKVPLNQANNITTNVWQSLNQTANPPQEAILWN